MITNLFIYGLMIITLFFTLTIIRRSHYINRMKNIFYSLATIANIIILIAFVALTIGMEYKIELLETIPNLIVFSVSLIVPASLCMSLMKRATFKNVFPFILFPILIAGFAIASIFTGWINSSEIDNPLYIANYAITALYFLLWGLMSIKTYRDNDTKEKVFVFFIFVIMAVSVAFDYFTSDLEAIWITSPVVMILTYILNVEISSDYDVMTGVRNRAAYDERIANLSQKSEYTVIVLDVNRLKYVNDTFGHKKGDELIILASSTIAKNFYKIGKTYRIGGDEFLCLVENINDGIIREACKKTVDKLRNTSLGIEYIPSISWGLCTHVSGEKETYQECMKIADDNMYEMKQHVHKFMDEGKDPFAEQHDWEAIWYLREKTDFKKEIEEKKE